MESKERIANVFLTLYTPLHRYLDVLLSCLLSV